MTTATVTPPPPPSTTTTTAAAPAAAAKPAKPAAAAPTTESPLPTDTQLFLRSLHLREAGQPLFFAAVTVLLCMPDLFDLASPASVLPAAVRGVLADVPGLGAALGHVHAASLALRAMWASMVEYWGVEGFMTIALFLWTTALYWTHALLLGVLDVSLRFPSTALGRFALAHKIQDGKLVSSRDWVKCALVVLRNQVFINIPYGLVLFKYAYPAALQYHHGLSTAAAATSWAASLPSAATVARDLAICAGIEELLFYSSHRLFHWGPLYRAFHKQHHEFTAPVGLAATYAHPVEHLLSNLTPVLGGIVLFAMHPFSALVWVTLAITTTVHTHSGYELFGWPSARKHDWHHYAFIYQFGVSGVVDTFFGTDGGDRYRRYVHKYDQRVAAVKSGAMDADEAERKFQ
ncbi:hypothetical protein H9P43_003422 [Blastocladiella emersonii ATCC 22665]|nr:hypothetical protein H9P43_003422 [Blastocladiella emersonii ATCC 22665]